MSDFVKMNNNSDEVMFLFGAGISIPIGIPAMQGIYRAYMNKKQSGISDIEKKTCKFFTDKMGVEQDLEEFLLAANSIIEFKDSNLNRFVEENVSRVKTSNKIKEYNKNLKNNLKNVIDVKKGILSFLSQMCFKFDRKKAEKINTGFVKAMSRLEYPIYSTNYDFAFEYVAIENEIKIYDNFKKRGQRNLWNENIDFSGSDGFKLIKLHGSVTWYQDGEGTIEKINYSTKINPVGKKVENIVIVPTRFKDIYAQHFFALYSHFLSTLARSKLIIIAGHSLRDDYLRAGIIERKRKGDFQIIVIDPTFPNEIKNELPPSRLRTVGDVIHIPYKWEEFSDEISSILLNSQTDQIVKNCINIMKKKKTKNKLKIKGNIRAIEALKNKEINIDLRAYLKLTERPSRLRVWLKATYVNDRGVEQNQVSAQFIELDEILYGDDLSGLANTTEKLRIKIPKIIKWLEVGCKVSLIVGLVKAHIKKPLNITHRNIIVKDEKKLIYKK